MGWVMMLLVKEEKDKEKKEKRKRERKVVETRQGDND